MKKLSVLVLTVATSLSLMACNQTKDAPETAEKIGTDTTVANTQTDSANKYKDIQGVAMNITGAGASYPAPIYAKWSADYHTITGGKVNYQSIGSSGGVKQIIEKTIDFGASDAPMTPEELQTNGLIQFPTLISGVVPVINIEGIVAGELTLDGGTLANIYMGKIKNWNDPAITALNEGITLPDAPITTVYRSDGSGTTFNFTDYLAKVSGDWANDVGVNKSISWPTASGGTGAGGKGNEGVASTVSRIPNSIGYVEYAHAKQNNLAHIKLINAAGHAVEPSADTFAAAGDVDWSQATGFYKVITNSETEQAWPIAAATFILVHKQPSNPEQVAGVLNFFNWAYDQGNQSAIELDYVPFSDKAVDLFKDEWKKIVRADGIPAYTPQ